MATLRRFERCWTLFQDFYRSTQRWQFPAGGGTLSDVIWGENDVAFHLGRFCAAEFGLDWVHFEVTGLGGPIPDLVITAPELWTRAVAERKPLTIGKDITLDLVVEIAIVAGRHPSYSPQKVRNDAEKLQGLVQSGKARLAALCVLHKIQPDAGFYGSLKADFPRVEFFHVSD